MGYSLYVDAQYIGIFNTLRELMAKLKFIGVHHDFDIYEVV